MSCSLCTLLPLSAKDLVRLFPLKPLSLNGLMQQRTLPVSYDDVFQRFAFLGRVGQASALNQLRFEEDRKNPVRSESHMSPQRGGNGSDGCVEIVSMATSGSYKMSK